MDNFDDNPMFEDEELLEVIDADEEPTNVEDSEFLKLTFHKHKKAVFSGTLSDDCSLAVTGGEDDTAYVWNTDTSEVLFECRGHKDSVIEVAFNHDNNYVATGDLGGTIQVWKVADKSLQWITDQNEDLCWLSWHDKTDVLFAGFKSGLTYVWKIPEGRYKTLVFATSSSNCGKLLNDGKRLIVAYEDGSLRLWDLKTESVIWVSKDEANKSIVSIDITSDSTLCFVAPSGLLYKISDGVRVSKLSVAAAEDGDIEVAKFNTNLGVLLTGSISGKVCMWDYKKGKLRHENSVGRDVSITCLAWGGNETFLIGTTDCNVHCCKAKTSELIATYQGHVGTILSLSVAKDNSCILTTSEDGSAKIFSINECYK